MRPSWWRRPFKAPVCFYNLRVGRHQGQVEREIRAILSTRPAWLDLVEAVGYRLPRVAGYQLIRDTATPGRANLASYVREDLPVQDVAWIPCAETWSRPHGPGRHWPREILTYRAAGIRKVVAHQPPRWTDNTIQAQREGIEKMTRLLAPWTLPRWSAMPRKHRRTALARPRFAMMDANRTARDPGPSPAVLARRARGRVIPEGRIDCAVITGQVRVHVVTRPTFVAGVRLKSDHPHALRMVISVPRKWTQEVRPRD